MKRYSWPLKFQCVNATEVYDMKATSEEARVFVEVVEHKSFTKAADKLNLLIQR